MIIARLITRIKKRFMGELICYKTKLKISLEASKMKFNTMITLPILMLIGKYSVMAAGKDNRDIRINDNGGNIHHCPLNHHVLVWFRCVVLLVFVKVCINVNANELWFILIIMLKFLPSLRIIDGHRVWVLKNFKSWSSIAIKKF